ncbi:MAG: ferritin-like domain-containing protein [Pseudomonadota bacterium]
MELRQRALAVFSLTDPHHKAEATMALALDSGQPHALDCHAQLHPVGPPGRPLKPELVHPQQVPRRSPFTAEGHCALLHSIAHIEFNAINLALDAIWRFAGMPADYYTDWLLVAQEEAKHFMLLRQHLLDEGHDYGDFVAHDGMWTMCENTRHDVTTRMALVPRTMEARGLDATPIIQAKLRRVGTPRALAAVDILEIILTEEVGHVTIGNRWYHWLCQREGLDPMAFYADVASKYGAPRLKPPFNLRARKLAGFSDAEIAALPTGETT